MKKENFKIKSNCDGLELDTMLFIPDKLKAVVALSHGMVERKEYYFGFMEYLAQNGYASIIHDHRGHGKSVRSNNDYGYFYDETSDYIVEDIHQIIEYLKERFNGKEIILLGHSMGSLVVRKYIKKYDDKIDKLIVCGSPSINKMTDLGLLLCKVIKLFKGERYRSKFINKMVLPSKHNWLSNDLDYVKEYKKDKLCGFIFTINGFINLMNLLKSVYSKKNWVLNNKKLNILFIAGEDDPIIVSEKLWHKSIDFLKNVGYKNIDYKLYHNMKHALLLEKEKEIVYEDVIKYIEKGRI